MKYKFFREKVFFLRERKVSVLLLLVFIASGFLIFINYYTIKTTSAVRAYINGESEYSKGQKDALLYLLTYIQTEDEQYWTYFQTSIDVPVGDNVARKSLLSNGSTSDIEKGFLRGKNHPDDLEQMEWLFKNFQSVSFMKQAIKIWQDAEPFINELAAIGNESHDKIKTHSLTADRRQQLVKKVNEITTALTLMEREFSNVLGAAARTINQYLFYTNIIFIILIVGSVSGYSINMVKKLMESEKVLINRNQDLTNTNRELDNFVHIASHDLRAPIASLKGLIQITMEEDEKGNIKKYLHIMENIVNRQDSFIKEIIEYSRNKLTSVNIEKISLKTLIKDAVEQNRYAPEAKNITIVQEIDVDNVYGDALRMKIILNNIISNAIRYSDEQKDNKHILIKAIKQDRHYMISVEDNGIGIDKKDHERIFDIFFGTNHNKKSTGLGLYITRETVYKLNGTIKVESEKNKGTKFIITLPLEI